MAVSDTSEYNRQFHQEHKSEIAEKKQQWYQDNKERLRLKKQAWRQENPEAATAERRKYRYAMRDLILEHKKAGACMRCGIADYRVLDFHHRDSSQKEIDVNRGWKQNIGRQAILDEIAKCDLVCANCHRILHWEERNGA